MTDLKTLKRFYDNKDLKAILDCVDGIRFLKLYSISRNKGLFEKLAADFGVENRPKSEWLELIFTGDVSTERIDSFIKTNYELVSDDVAQAISDSMVAFDTYDWGGIYMNNLDKALIDNYVKKIKDVEILNEKMDEIQSKVKNYIYGSWYNTWTSYVIEDIFKRHDNVIPCVGLIKMVDFFVLDNAFDLKVTYMPEDFISSVRKQRSLKSEHVLLKRRCKQLRINVPSSLTGNNLIKYMKQNILLADPDCVVIREINDFRLSLFNDVKQDSVCLIKWLYENQGEVRFDSSNRIYLILVDKADFHKSWEIKKEFDLIRTSVNNYLGQLINPKLVGMDVRFRYKNIEYNVRADAIFVEK